MRACFSALTACLCCVGPFDLAAQNFKPMDQFHVVAIPDGITTAPRGADNREHSFVYRRRQNSDAQVANFVKAICRSPNAKFETLRPSWVQWLKGEIPARAQC